MGPPVEVIAREKIPEEIEDKIPTLMFQNPSKTGSLIEKLLVVSYGGEGRLPTNYPGCKPIMDKVNTWNETAKTKMKSAKKLFQ